MTAPSLYDTGPFAPPPRPFNLAAHTLAAADRTPDKIALEVLAAPGVVAERWSYARFRAAVCAAAGGLAGRGLGRGDRVLLRIGDSADFPVLFLAANALGAVPVPTSTLLTAPEVTALIADLRPRAILCGAGVAPPPDPAGADLIGPDAIAALGRAAPAGFAPTDPDDPAYILYTSGSSGGPKGVLHAQRAAWARRMMWAGWYGLTTEDRVLHAGAFNWAYTLGAGLMDPFAAGATALIYAGPRDRDVWPALAAAHGATLFAAAPGVYRQMLAAPGLATGFAGLRHGLSAGEALPAAVAAAWSGATGKPIYEAIGMTEISTYVSFSPSSPPVPGCVGRPQPGRRVAILPETELPGEAETPDATGRPAGTGAPGAADAPGERSVPTGTGAPHDAGAPCGTAAPGDPGAPGDTGAPHDAGAPCETPAPREAGAPSDTAAPRDPAAPRNPGAPRETASSRDTGAPCDAAAAADAGAPREAAVTAGTAETPVPRGEAGLLAVSRRDPGLMLGYWGRPEETAAAFRGEWFVTGDRARMDATGAIAHLGRANDVMNAGGYRVSPGEVEAALAAHPGVAEAAVAEIAVRPGVSIIAAFYVPTAEPVAETELAAHCAARLARYKLPRAFHPLAALPRTANGKLRRRDLPALAPDAPAG